ncbi:hypothetical protein LRS11_21280 [Pseudomonas sp. J452]|uniref:hypothetical protein n=1 Tax=Pseudomonas sp. J452 TaxID=2898441 RepID=UPI0021AD6B5C|nr:hypothetical protein [Pseudomonas sp. J452]UUY08294.1 hypothetical protein LRS11_21280 [Pseudomonas sp. J452]
MATGRRRKRLALSLGLLLLCGEAQACSYDGLALDLALAHPASLDVSLALHQAYQSKRLATPLLLPGGFGMRRTLSMLEKLRVALAPVVAGESFSLLLVEPGLWAHFDGSGAQLRVTLHVAAPGADDNAIITGEGVLQALVQGKLSAEQALQAGLLQVQAAPGQRERLSGRWSQAFTPSSIAAR